MIIKYTFWPGEIRRSRKMRYNNSLPATSNQRNEEKLNNHAKSTSPLVTVDETLFK